MSDLIHDIISLPYPSVRKYRENEKFPYSNSEILYIHLSPFNNETFFSKMPVPCKLDIFAAGGTAA